MKDFTFGFVGLGLIGGSIAKALKLANPSHTIIAYDISRDALKLAEKERIADICLTEITEVFGTCDYIFLCAPVIYNEENLLLIKSNLKPGCILTDVGSVKTSIHEKIKSLGLSKQFIGGHPMTGSERTGFLNSKASLLENAYYILTPGELVPADKVRIFSEIIISIKALPLILDYKEHDYITAAISHVPHIIAYTLVDLVKSHDNPEQIMRTLAAGGFKDITRIASSSPVMWQQICVNNQDNIVSLLNSYILSLQDVKKRILENDNNWLFEYFDKARTYRDSFIDASPGPVKKVFSIHLDIPDKAGALATIATLLAGKNINIKNIGIVHNREAEDGVLKIEFYDDAAVDEAKLLLREQNYTVH